MTALLSQHLYPKFSYYQQKNFVKTVVDVIFTVLRATLAII